VLGYVAFPKVWVYVVRIEGLKLAHARLFQKAELYIDSSVMTSTLSSK